jgi:hypothetical protein
MEDEIYYAISIAALIGISLVVYDIATSEKPQEKFTELYFMYERKTLENQSGVLRTNLEGIDIYVKMNEVWIDLNSNGVQDADEIFLKGDSFTIAGKDWNVSDFSDTEILLGGYPKQKTAGSMSVSFEIVNHQGETHTYEYTIYSDGVLLQSEKIEAPLEEKKLLTCTIEVKEKGNHKILVRLDTGEEIYFWVVIT